MRTPFDPSHPAFDKWLREPLDDEERELMNPDNWDNPVEGRTVGTPGAVLRVRFTRDEYLALARIARDAGVGPVAFIQQTMLELMAAHQEKEEARNHRRRHDRQRSS